MSNLSKNKYVGFVHSYGYEMIYVEGLLVNETFRKQDLELHDESLLIR